MADADWNACLAFVLAAEGGYVDDPMDPGGATNLGITLDVLSQWRHSAVTKDDVKNSRPGRSRRDLPHQLLERLALPRFARGPGPDGLRCVREHGQWKIGQVPADGAGRRRGRVDRPAHSRRRRQQACRRRHRRSRPAPAGLLSKPLDLQPLRRRLDGSRGAGARTCVADGGDNELERGLGKRALWRPAGLRLGAKSGPQPSGWHFRKVPIAGNHCSAVGGPSRVHAIVGAVFLSNCL